MNYTKKIKRYKTKVVKIGDIPLGGDYPVRLQSMTTTDTMDTKATVEQSIRIIEAGSEYVRITAPSIKEAKNLELIKKEIRKCGYNTPLIADIHFTPNAAELAARIVEKVRVNPGNYADKKKFDIIEYTDAQYNEELERIRERFTPLVKICKEYGTAMRIGTNHGSLSDRIMSRYGDSPLGMVESALEFLRICEENNYYEIVLSMKASNPGVMIEAYRLLVEKMTLEKMNYPLHLGVTEAGDGEDGRIKSALGIGVLLEEGLGDTIRVSLTEEPEFEIPVCKILAKRYLYPDCDEIADKFSSVKISSTSQIPLLTKEVDKTGNRNVPVVILSPSKEFISSVENFKEIGYLYSQTLDKWTIGDVAPDYIYLGSNNIDYKLPGTLVKIFDYIFWLNLTGIEKSESMPLLNTNEYLSTDLLSDKGNFVECEFSDLTEEIKDKLKVTEKIILVMKIGLNVTLQDLKKIYDGFTKSGILCPVVLKYNYSGLSGEEFSIYSATDAGGVFIENSGSGIWLEFPDIKKANTVSFGILQASRRRISKTEYISCPSCGRTLFDLQETTAMIRNATNHLKGVKIAIMGCIVNGPGEMADADYGYVGSGPGKITLYKGREVVKRSIPSENALAELINLIKENSDWV